MLRDRRAWIIVIISSMIAGPGVLLILSHLIGAAQESAALAARIQQAEAEIAAAHATSGHGGGFLLFGLFAFPDFPPFFEPPDLPLARPGCNLPLLSL